MSGGFDKKFPDDVSKELKLRQAYVEEKNVEWNYGKYAYITIQSTGESQTVIKSEKGLILGDGAKYIKEPHINLYTDEGGVRKFKPQLKSCKITNEGGTDYTDSYLYNVEFSFTVFTQSDLNRAESNFFRVGGEILVEFGWHKLQGEVNRNHIKANVFNYDFTMNEDGSFDCNVKAMSPAGLWNGEDMQSTDTKEVDGEEEPVNFLGHLEEACREAFGLDSDDGPDSVDDLGNNKLRVVNGSFGADRGTFCAAELIIEPGFFNDDEQYLFYTTIGTLIRYINSKADKTGNRYKVAAKDAPGGYWPINNDGIGSADPKDFFLPGDQGSYGDPSDGSNAANFAEWGNNLERDCSYQDANPIEQIAISFPFLTKTYQSMADSAPTVGGFKQSPKISEYLKTLFARLENLTGGLIALACMPMKGTESLSMSNQVGPFDITILNKKTIEPDLQTAFEFVTIGRKSITKSVSLSSEFDADYVLMATQANIEKGSSNGQNLLKDNGGIYPKNPKITKKLVTGGSEAEVIDNKKLKDLRNKIGDLGASPERLTAYGDACKTFIIREARTDKELSNGRYGEIQYTLNLSVTIDGIWKIPFLAPISVDRIPQIFKSKDVMFSVTAVNHEFDGKGGWDTSLETVMRIP